jgi:uncharacterized protein YndB with AHSA1/START domain
MAASAFGELRHDRSGRAVRFERHYATNVDDLWSACTEPERLARWFADVSGDFNVGGKAFIDFRDGDHTEISIRRCEPPHVLELDWAFGDDAMSVLAVELTASDDGGTLLVLDHRALPTSSATGYAAGWHAYLDLLEACIADREIGTWQQRFNEVVDEYREAPVARR